MNIELASRHTPGANVSRTADGWRMDIPAGPRRVYRLAQMDDYMNLPRRSFPWDPSTACPPAATNNHREETKHAKSIFVSAKDTSRSSPLRGSKTPREPRGVAFSLRARLSASNLPGTWGFGLWNDPFGFAIGFGGTARRLPALPNTAWFFHASPENYLSLHIDTPANGFFAGMFRSPRWPTPLLAPALLALPFLALRPASRLLRRLASRLIQQDGSAVSVDVTQWHEYSIRWQAGAVLFFVDGVEILRTPLAPRGPLGLVLWIDNQYAAWRPDGSLGYGTLANPAAWLEIKNIVTSG